MPWSSFPARNVLVRSEFWSPFLERAQTSTLPAIFEAQKSWNHWTCLTWSRGHEPKPHQFWDSDIYKAVEATCGFLLQNPNADLLAIVEEAVDMIRAAQYEDGYINSFYTVSGIERRWTNLRDDHELYCMGHLLEAAVAYETLAQNGRLLDVANKLCKHLDDQFGPEEGKMRGYPGHQEVEIGLLRFHELTGDPLPLKLARFFVLERGKADAKGENYFDKEAIARGGDPYDFMGSEFKAWYHLPRDYGYQQASEPIVDATEVKGHAVRAMYYYTAATQLLRLLPPSDEVSRQLSLAVKRLWTDLTRHKLYVTGAIGSDQRSEGFAAAYFLPNLEVEGCYGETCASFALITWCSELLRQELRSEYADVAEVVLYNSFLGAMSVDGDAFYYQNVLWSKHGQPKERNKWFGVACCPPNVAKLLGNMANVAYSHDINRNTIAIHQYVGGTIQVPNSGNEIHVTSKFPWHGTVTIKVTEVCQLALRIPSWAQDWKCSIKGDERQGYLYVEAHPRSPITLDFPIVPQKLYTNPRLGRDEVCIKRGPIVYCFENTDNTDVNLDQAYMTDCGVSDGPVKALPVIGQVPFVSTEVRQLVESTDSSLYLNSPRKLQIDCRQVVALPYFLRANRGGNGAMRVWVPRRTTNIQE